AALAAGGAGYAMVHPLMESAPEHRAAGVWLRAAWRRAAAATPEPAGGTAEAASGAAARGPDRSRPIVMSRKTWVAFYAGGLIAELPEGGIDSVIARARRIHADVLVVDERWAVPNRPALAP